MRAVLDHIGIAVKDLDVALAFYRDALGLEIEPPEEVTSQRVRAHFVPVGQSTDREAGAPEVKLELLEATTLDSPIAKYLEKRGPGLHHITLRVDDIAAALAQLKTRGAKLIDEQPRVGAEGALVAFIHPSSAHGVLVELKQSADSSRQSAVGSRQSADSSRQSPVASRQSAVSSRQSSVGSQQSAGSSQQSAGSSRLSLVGSQQLSPVRYRVGELELISLSDGFFRLDGGAMFGIVPRTLWSSRFLPDARNRIRLAMRPLIVRGVRTMLIDAGIGDKESEKFRDLYGVERDRHLEHALAEAGLKPENIDIVLATHLHFDHAGGFTVRDESGRLRPRFPRARYVVRRGEWEDATHPHERNRGSYLADNFLPLADAGVLELVDDDQTIMPGVRVRRTGGHTMHHQIIWIESEGRRAVYPADLLPTAAHVGAAWIMGIDLYPVDTLGAKKAFLREAADGHALILFDHDPAMLAGHVTEENGKFKVVDSSQSTVDS